MNIYDSMPTSDDKAVWDAWLSMHYLPAVTVADELGIFKSLLESPAGADQLAKRMGFNDRATRATLRLLARWASCSSVSASTSSRTLRGCTCSRTARSTGATCWATACPRLSA